MADILIVDDDQMLCGMLIDNLEQSGHTAVGAYTLTDGINIAEIKQYDVVLLDVQLPDGNGLDHIQTFTDTPSSPEVIIITGQGDLNGAELAITNGAWSYIAKPHVIRELLLHLTRALQYRDEKKRLKIKPVALKRERIIGNSSKITDCLDQIANAASCDASILITGETGTGKELFAYAVHENSNRADNDFIIVDCAALPETLIESTLFGYTKGAFTGAEQSKEGLIKQANSGTLFLDEIGELPLSLQKAFLRVLQEHCCRPVGSSQEIKSNFRVVAATNKDLEQCVKEGTFRSDLLYRLQGIRINLPPLKDRVEDVKELATHYIEKICNRYGIETKGIAPDFINALKTYEWPGNIRELFQVIEQVLANTMHNPTLFTKHLPQKIRVSQALAEIQQPKTIDNFTQPEPSKNALSGLTDPNQPSWREYKNISEKNYLYQLMQNTNGKIKLACNISGLSRTRLYQLLAKHSLYSARLPKN